MSHEIEMRADGTGAAAYAFQPAWHNLGVVLEDSFITSQKAFDLVPELRSPVHLEQVTRKGVEVPNKKYTVREADDKVLGIVGDRYTVLQNTEALDLLDSLVIGGEAQYESIMSLRGGAQVALVVNLKDLGVKVGGVDKVDAYALLTNSHDGSSAVTFAITPIRVVCQNTLQWALQDTKIQHKVRHSRNMQTRMAEVKTILNITSTYMTAFEANATRLMDKAMSDGQWEDFLGKLIVMPEDDGRGKTIAQNKQDELTRVWRNLEETAAEAYKNTRWGAIQAVSHYNQRLATVQAKGLNVLSPDFEDQKERKQAENRFFRTLHGTGSNLTDDAFALLAADLSVTA